MDNIFKPQQVMSGSYGTCMINGEVIAEVFEWTAQIKVDRKEIKLPGGQMGKKITGQSGEGTLKRYKLNSKWTTYFEKLKDGKEVLFELYLEVNDPDAAGAEAIKISECWNDEGYEFSAKHGEEITEELKFGFIANKLKSVERA